MDGEIWILRSGSWDGVVGKGAYPKPRMARTMVLAKSILEMSVVGFGIERVAFGCVVEVVELLMRNEIWGILAGLYT